VSVQGLTTAGLLVAMLAGTARGEDASAEAVHRRDAAWLEAARRSREALEWTDELVRHDWRLQRRPGTETCRVLDPADGVVREGTAAECRATFTTLETEGRVPPVRGHAVILLHGLGEGRDSMRPLADHLRRSLDATVVTFGYASLKADIDAHGRALDTVVSGLPHAARISFVGHSLGNLVVRRWMAIAKPDERARVHRMVMLGPPNQGSDLARMAARVWGVAETAEGAARDLVVEWQRVAPGLAVPECPFGIVAGGKGDDDGYSLLLDGDDDAVVRVAETHLPGAEGFVVLPVHHAAMMRDADVQRATREFLATGRFPAPRPTPAPAPR
jgi:alpha-beta hydrolase superfamily lysophospholipase